MSRKADIFSVCRSSFNQGGFSLVELLVVIGIIILLVGILAPCLSMARKMAKFACCAAQLSSTGKAVFQYAAENDKCLPPFAFSSPTESDLILSGHWGGYPPGHAQLAFFHGMDSVNLYALVNAALIPAEILICPGAKDVDANSYFTDTDQFSTYCLRFPVSESLFNNSEPTKNRNGTLLGVYKMLAGGQSFNYLNQVYIVPQVRFNRVYEDSQGSYHPAENALAADHFAPSHRCHDDKFNVLYGDGAVQATAENEEIAAEVYDFGSASPGETEIYARSEKLWRLLEEK